MAKLKKFFIWVLLQILLCGTSLCKETDDDNTVLPDVPDVPDATGATESSPERVESKYLNKATYDKVKHVLLAANVPFVDNIDKIETVLSDWFSADTPSIWAQVKDKVDEVFAEHTTSTIFSLLQNEFDSINLILKKGRGIDLVPDMQTLVAQKSQFFPQQHSTGSITFDKKWVAYVIFYIRASSLIHLELMRPERPKSQKLHKCAYHNELAVFRNDVIGAAQQMFKLRYQHTLKGKSWDYLNRNEDIVLDSTKYLVPHNSYNQNLMGIITFHDTLTNQNSTIWLKHVKHYYFNEVIMDGMHNLTSWMTGFYNDLVGENCQQLLEGSGCECPEPIEDEEVMFPFTQPCFGKVTESTKECRLPCLQYDGPGYYGCPIDTALTSGRWYKPGATGLIRLFKISGYANFGKCDRATQSTWDKCMHVPRPSPSAFDIANYVTKFKKKKKQHGGKLLKKAGAKKNDDKTN